MTRFVEDLGDVYGMTGGKRLQGCQGHALCESMALSRRGLDVCSNPTRVGHILVCNSFAHEHSSIAGIAPEQFRWLVRLLCAAFLFTPTKALQPSLQRSFGRGQTEHFLLRF